MKIVQVTCTTCRGRKTRRVEADEMAVVGFEDGQPKRLPVPETWPGVPPVEFRCTTCHGHGHTEALAPVTG